MALPTATSAFPAPAPALPPATPSWLFGATAADQQLVSAAPAAFSLGTPTTTSPPAWNPTATSLSALSALTGGALGPNNDPHMWTPEEAAAQTDRALARIGQVNPELARAIAEQRGKSQGEDLPWYKDIMKGVGDVLHATKLDVVFDYLGRSSHVVPEIIHDWGKESVWKNMGDALSGQSTTSWSDVLADKFGVQRNFFSAAVGMLGDIATDPLTYLTFGAGALGRDVIGTAAAKATMVANLEKGIIEKVGPKGVSTLALDALKAEVTPLVRETAAKTGQTVEEVIASSLFSETSGAKGLIGRLRTLVHPDAVPGFLFNVDQLATREAALGLISNADKAYKLATTVGWARASESIASEYGIDKAAATDVLKRWVSQGTGIGVSRDLYAEGKAAAGALGGIRLRLSIPVFDIRVAGARLPLLPSRLDFSLGRRFFSGLSGNVKLMKMVENGEASLSDLELFWSKAASAGVAGDKSGGFSALKEFSPDVWKKLGGRTGSIFYSTSEGIGRLTSHFSAHAAQLRGGGLAAKYAAEANIQGRHIVQQVIDRVQTVNMPDGTVLVPDATVKAVVRGAVAAGETGATAKGDFLDLLNEYTRLVPDPGVDAKTFFEEERRRIVALDPSGTNPEVQGQLRRLDDEAKRAVEVEAELKAKAGDAGVSQEVWRTYSRQRNQVLDEAGLPNSGRDSLKLNEVNDIRPEDAAANNPAIAEGIAPQVTRGSDIGVEQITDVGPSGVPARGLTILDPLPHDASTLAPAEPDELIRDLSGGATPGRFEGQVVPGSLAEKVQKNAKTARRFDHTVQFEDLTKGLSAEETQQVRDALDALRQDKADIGTSRLAAREVAKTAPLNPSEFLIEDSDYEALYQNLERMSREAQGNPEFADSYVQIDEALNLLTHAMERGDPLTPERIAAAMEGIDPQLMLSMSGDPLQEIADVLGRQLPGADLRPVEGVFDPVSGETVIRYEKNPAAALQQTLLDDALARVHAEGVQTLTGPERDALVNPKVAAFYQNPYEIDRSTAVAGTERQATELVDQVSALHDSINQLFDQVEAGNIGATADVKNGLFASAVKAKAEADGLSPEAVDEVKRIVESEASRQQQLADITTEYLKAQGYDALRIKTDKGFETRVFYDAKTDTMPVARLNPRATPFDRRYGTQLRGISDGARQQIIGDGADATKRALVDEIMRRTEGKFRQDAEKLAVSILSDHGITLPAGTTFFERDAVKVLHSSTSEVGRQVTGKFLGQAARSAEHLGLSRGPLTNLAAVGVGRYRTVLNDTGVRALEEQADATKEAARRVSILSDQQIPRLKAEAEKVNAAYNEYDQKLQTMIDSETERVNAVLNDIAHKTSGTEALDRTMGEQNARRAVELADEEFQARLMSSAAGNLAEGESLRQLKVFENGRTIWRHGAQAGPKEAGGTVTYYMTEATAEGPRVIGYREAEGLRASSSLKVQAEAAARDAGATTNLDAYRMVSTYTHPDRVRTGVGGSLLDAHWSDMNFTDWHHVATAIHAQAFSTAGGGLNIDAATRWSKRFISDAKKKADELAREAKRVQYELDLKQTGLREAESEFNRIAARASTARAPILAALVPATDAANRVGMTVLPIRGFEDFAMPTFMAEEFKRALTGYKALDGVHGDYRQFMSWWKTMATWLTPGFHVRNMQGAWFNNWLGGVGLRDYVSARRIRMAEREVTVDGKVGRWGAMKVSAREPDLVKAMLRGTPTGSIGGKRIEDLTYGDLAKLGADMNVTASNGRAFAEAQMTVERAERTYKGHGTGGYVGHLAQPYVKLMRGTGTMTENVFRTAALVRGLRDGRGLMESRAFTMLRHGDYEDMTDWEYNWVRDIIPFYKWMRTNTPFQIHQLLESPGKLLAVQKAQREAFSAQGGNYDQSMSLVPDWMKESVVIPTHLGKDGAFNSVMLDLPMSDLFMSGRDFISSMLPIVKPFLESYVFHQSTFSGAPLEGKQVPMNPIFNPLAPVLDAVGLINRGADGNMYMSDKTQNILGIIPIYSRFKNFIYEDPKRVTGRANLIASAVFGIGLRNVDQTTIADTELAFYYDNVLPAVQYLNDLGYQLPTTTDLQHTIGTTDQILSRLGITPGPASELPTP